MANPVVNIPPTGPAVPPPYGTAAGPQNPYATLASNIGAYVNAKTHHPKAWGFDELNTVQMATFASLGAGLTGSVQSAAIILPQYCKIPKVAVGYKSVDVFTGATLDTFNIVVESCGDYVAPAVTTPPTQPNAAMANGSPYGAGSGYGASYTAGAVQTTGPGDNSGTYGYPTQFAAVGTCLFGTDISFSSTYFTSPSAGTGGGNEVFATTEWDTVYAAGTILSLRAVTTASTGSVTGLVISLLIQVLDKFQANDRSIPIIAW